VKESPYFRQAQLILRVMPHVTAETCFALKGGTAINLFVRDLPRLSVDIDLAYLPIGETRDIALKQMGLALSRIVAGIKRTIPGVKVQETYAQKPKRVTKIIVATGQTRITIEPNEVIRGSVFPAEDRDLSRRAEDMFELSVTARVLSIADLYGGKLCAALDRQHPRDLFDVRELLANEGITNEIRKAFVVYLASHNRPMSELLNPTRKDIRSIYENEFEGMTIAKVGYESLINARERLVTTLKKGLTNDEKHFLVSLKEGKPRWSIMAIDNIEKLPAIQWKLENIRKMDQKKHIEAVKRLKRALELEE
jgi:predicted nucleotidyltransferase component of viral defense system